MNIGLVCHAGDWGFTPFSDKKTALNPSFSLSLYFSVSLWTKSIQIEAVSMNKIALLHIILRSIEVIAYFFPYNIPVADSKAISKIMALRKVARACPPLVGQYGYTCWIKLRRSRAAQALKAPQWIQSNRKKPSIHVHVWLICSSKVWALYSVIYTTFDHFSSVPLFVHCKQPWWMDLFRFGIKFVCETQTVIGWVLF